MDVRRAQNAPADRQEASLWYAQAMEQLIEVVQQLSLARDLPTVMDIVRHAARNLTGADGATFVLRDNEKCFYAEEDAISPLWKGQRFPMSACISGWAMINKQPAVIEDIFVDPRIPVDAYRPTFVRSLAMVPIRTIDPIGAIGNYWATQHLPTPEQVKVLQALADTTAVAMENVRIYENLEQRVRLRTEELQSILDNVQIGIVFAVDDKVVRANPHSAAIFGYDSMEDMLGSSLGDLLRSAEDSASLVDAAKTCFAKGEVFSAESRMARHDNKEFWGRLVAKSLHAGSHPDSEIWVINDIGRRKEREQRLNELKLAAEAANHAKDSFLATMSHEIRTPLTGMLGMLELLSMTELDDEQRSTLEAAWDSGRGLLRIVSDILDWSKIEDGKLELSLRPTSIPQLLQEVVNTYSRVASSKSLLLWQHVDKRLNDAYIVDGLRLTQVLNNFVSNAIKFTREGEIELRADLLNRLDSGDRVRFSVKDTGIGIAADVQGRLFQLYHQGSADTARMYGGTGLGLAICRRLAEMMDGQIELKSELGAGSTFAITLTLPVSGVPGERVQGVHAEVKQREVEPLFTDSNQAPIVLAVDDHPVNRELLARQIKLLGMRAEIAENGLAALTMWRGGHHALIITDCHMPEMSGYELAREIRKSEADGTGARTTIIAWTANALAEEAGNCRQAGMDDLLVKPANLGQLRKMLAKWLRQEEGNDGSSGGGQRGERFPPIDHSILDMVIAERDAQNKVLQDFLVHIRADGAKLLELIEQGGGRAGIESAAHRMKGACQMVGAVELTAVCAAVERAAHEGDMRHVHSAAAPLEEVIRHLESYLESYSRKEVC